MNRDCVYVPPITTLWLGVALGTLWFRFFLTFLLCSNFPLSFLFIFSFFVLINFLCLSFIVAFYHFFVFEFCSPLAIRFFHPIFLSYFFLPFCVSFFLSCFLYFHSFFPPSLPSFYALGFFSSVGLYGPCDTTGGGGNISPGPTQKKAKAPLCTQPDIPLAFFLPLNDLSLMAA